MRGSSHSRRAPTIAADGEDHGTDPAALSGITSAHHQHTAQEGQQQTCLADDGHLTIQLPRALSYAWTMMQA